MLDEKITCKLIFIQKITKLFFLIITKFKIFENDIIKVGTITSI